MNSFKGVIYTVLKKIKNLIIGFLRWVHRVAKFLNKHAKIRWPETMMAVANIILAIVTWRYVVLTKYIVQQQINQTNQQKEQFELVNRAKVWFQGLSGDIQKGNLLFINSGNLPAKYCKFLWRIVKVDGEQVLQEFKEQSNIIKIDSLDQEEIFSLPYSSNFSLKDQIVFLVVVWKYSGKGIEDSTPKEKVLLWNIDQKPNAAWVIPSSSMGSNHVSTLDAIKKELRSALDKE
ncbi:MAG: hypothetical protein AB1755_00515 [Candidatus Omnitrophota bacterium]